MVVGCKNIEPFEFTESSFSDVSVDAWYFPYIEYAYESGWVEGHEDGTFRPENNVNRVEALKMILLAKYSEEEIVGGGHNFVDTIQGEWYEKYVNFAAEKGFIGGYRDEKGNPTGYFGPGNDLTRAEAAKILFKVFFRD